MNRIRIFAILFLFVIFIIGAYATMYFNVENPNIKNRIENMEPDLSCPDMLVKKGETLVLYNKKKPEIAGINPIIFRSLDDYIEFIQGQRAKGIDCPVLYLQQETTTQGEDVYRLRPSPFELQGGLNQSAPPMDPVTISDANRENPPYNQDNYPGFDPEGQYIGIYTNLDAVHDSTKNTTSSDNPMDYNWGGVNQTRIAVESGKYEGRQITRPVYNQTTNVSFFPTIPSNVEQPMDIL
jgi:hypothetical protein